MKRPAMGWGRRCLRAPIAALALLAAAIAQGDECGGPYLGFDSRLSPTIVGRLGAGTEAISGFEISRGAPVVATGSSVIVFREGKSSNLLSGATIRSLSVDSTGKLWIQDGDRVSALDEGGLRDTKATVGGRLLNSGDPRFVEVSDTGSLVRILASGGRSYEVAALAEFPRAASWGARGLALVTMSSILTWKPGSTGMTILMRDSGLGSARDISSFSDDSVFLALAHSIVLVSAKGVTPIVAGFPARVRVWNGQLFILDEKSGLIWRVTGLENLKGPESDVAHAKEMAAGRRDAGEWKLAEAARILGCADALKVSGTPEGQPRIAGNEGGEWERILQRSMRARNALSLPKQEKAPANEEGRAPAAGAPPSIAGGAAVVSQEFFRDALVVRRAEGYDFTIRFDRAIATPRNISLHSMRYVPSGIALRPAGAGFQVANCRTSSSAITCTTPAQSHDHPGADSELLELSLRFDGIPLVINARYPR